MDSVQERFFWPAGRLTRCVVRESTIAVEKPNWLFDSLRIAFYKSDEKYAPKWIDWNALAKSFTDRRLCPTRIHADKLKTSELSTVVSVDSLKAVMSAGGDSWHAFYAHFPGAFGIVQFSRVGFNPDRSQAVVYTEHVAASLVGVGEYWFLRREGNRWILRLRCERWVS